MENPDHASREFLPSVLRDSVKSKLREELAKHDEEMSKSSLTEHEEQPMIDKPTIEEQAISSLEGRHSHRRKKNRHRNHHASAPIEGKAKTASPEDNAGDNALKNRDEKISHRRKKSRKHKHHRSKDGRPRPQKKDASSSEDVQKPSQLKSQMNKTKKRNSASL